MPLTKRCLGSHLQYGYCELCLIISDGLVEYYFAYWLSQKPDRNQRNEKLVDFTSSLLPPTTDPYPSAKSIQMNGIYDCLLDFQSKQYGYQPHNDNQTPYLWLLPPGYRCISMTIAAFQSSALGPHNYTLGTN